jgi:hypothetical protein
MAGGEISGNSSSSSSYGGGGVSVYSGTFTMDDGEISGNTASYYGGGVYVYSNGTFTKQSGGIIYGSNESSTKKNTATGGDNYGHAVYVSSGSKRRNTTAVGTLDSSIDGPAGGWEYTVTFDADGGSPATQVWIVTDGSTTVGSSNMPSADRSGGYILAGWYTSQNGGGVEFTGSTIVNADITVYAYWVLSDIRDIIHSSVSGGTWTQESDGRRRSPMISHGEVTKARISFTSVSSNASIAIQLTVSSESGYDFAFISELDNASATSQSGYYSGSRISGETSVTIAIPVSSSGSHFIDIGYRKDEIVSSGSDCVWYKVVF